VNIQQIMKQAQKVQQKMEEIQENLANENMQASSGGGMVTVVVNGKQEILSINIEKDVVNAEDIGMLQDLVVAAVNEGLKKSQDLVKERMKDVTGGMNIPGMM